MFVQHQLPFVIVAVVLIFTSLYIVVRLSSLSKNTRALERQVDGMHEALEKAKKKKKAVDNDPRDDFASFLLHPIGQDVVSESIGRRTTRMRGGEPGVGRRIIHAEETPAEPSQASEVEEEEEDPSLDEIDAMIEPAEDAPVADEVAPETYGEIARFVDNIAPQGFVHIIQCNVKRRDGAVTVEEVKD